MQIHQRIESVKKLFLRTILAGDKLNVINQQGVDLAVLILELVDIFRAECIHQLCNELFRGQIHHHRFRIVLLDHVSGGVQ